MDLEAKLEQYQASALREEEAAARAASPESARIHEALANMYHREAARVRIAGPLQDWAFG